jgi:sodium-dependent dicarboxylate transporter 2/3/5
MDKIQLIFFFISGFLVSRLIIKVKLPQRIVLFLIGKRHLSISTILLYLVALTAFLSFFIPNAITVLTLLPILELLRKAYAEAAPKQKSIPTMLALSVIYGANIGGMGSVTATPANGILVTYAELSQVAGRDYLNFAPWLIWGIPLVFGFVIVAWLILIGAFRPWRYPQNSVQLPFDAGQAYHPWQKITILITAVFFISSLLFSLWIMQNSGRPLIVLIVSGMFTLLFCLFLFFVPFKAGKNAPVQKPLLTIKDCYNELPTRGFVFVGIAIVLAGILYLLKADVYFSGWIGGVLPAHVASFPLFASLALLTSFATEVLSNTAVQLSLFVIALPLAETLSFSAIQALILITLSSTCAFMSPIATGVNGLAFGGVKKVSFVRMLAVGMIMNIAGALLISVWIQFVLGRLLGMQ